MIDGRHIDSFDGCPMAVRRGAPRDGSQLTSEMAYGQVVTIRIYQGSYPDSTYFSTWPLATPFSEAARRDLIECASEPACALAACPDGMPSFIKEERRLSFFSGSCKEVEEHGDATITRSKCVRLRVQVRRRLTSKSTL